MDVTKLVPILVFGADHTQVKTFWGSGEITHRTYHCQIGQLLSKIIQTKLVGNPSFLGGVVYFGFSFSWG